MLGKPEGSAFSLRDLVPENYRKSDAVRDAIIIALAIKVWWTPSLSSIGLSSAASSVGNTLWSVGSPSLRGISLPSLSSSAVHILAWFGLGWWIRGLYDGENIRIGEDTTRYADYQRAYRTLTGATEPSIFDTYKHMTWEVEWGSKIYRPVGTPTEAAGYQVLLLATKPDGSVDSVRTIVKKGSEKPTTLQAIGNASQNVIRMLWFNE